MSRRVLRLIVVALCGVVATAITLHLVERHSWPGVVRSALNLQSLPVSVRTIQCSTPFTTDVLATCAIELSPSDFPALLSGYAFTAAEASGTSHSQFLPKVGAAFPVATEFTVQPKSFVHGGHVKVFANHSRSHALIDLYIE